MHLNNYPFILKFSQKSLTTLTIISSQLVFSLTSFENSPTKSPKTAPVESLSPLWCIANFIALFKSFVF